MNASSVVVCLWLADDGPGCSEIEIREALLQSSVYGGAPAGMTGFKIAEKAIVEWAEENGQQRPVKGNGVNV